MKQKNFKNFIFRILCFIVGCFIIQIGVSFFIKSNTGVDSVTIFMQGLSNILQITVGQANMLFMGIVFVGILIFAREYIRLGTFLAVVTAGPFLDLLNQLFDPLGIESLPLIVRLAIVAISCVVIAIGFSILKSANLSVAPTDQLPIIICDKLKWQYKWVRITFDVILVVLGFTLGGKLGLGTIIATLLIGPCIQFFLTPIETKITQLSRA